MYGKKSGVLSISGPDYDRVIAKSNYTSVSPAGNLQGTSR
jgi:protein disulfide-isomerase A6